MDSDYLEKQNMINILLLPISLIKYVVLVTVYRTLTLVAVVLLSSALALIVAGIEWCLWKIYVIAIIKWISWFIYQLFAYPIQFVIWCYTDVYGFLCLVGIIMLSYCMK